MAEDDVVASALEVLEIAEVGRVGADAPTFSESELAFARTKSDPERRLAARLAAKRAAARLLGEGFELADVEIVRAAGAPPRLRLSPRAEARLHELGAARTLVSLTHERSHAAACVLFLRKAT